MLIRNNYINYKQDKVKKLILDMLDKLNVMMEQSDRFLINPTDNNKNEILENESFVNKYEKKIEKYTLEIYSLELLTPLESKYLYAMSRISRELERVGDQIVNIITISDVMDTNEIQPQVKEFYDLEFLMSKWLYEGIENNDPGKMEKVINQDILINKLNIETFNGVTKLIDHNQNSLTEGKLKMVIISRFLERIGDHFVNAAKLYMEVISEYK